MPTLGLIAGAGRLPALVAQGAQAAGFRVAVAAFEGIADPSLEGRVDRLTWLPLGQVEALFSVLRSEGASEVALAGKVAPSHLHAGLVLDDRGRALLETLVDRRDDPLLAVVAGAIEAEGFAIRPQSEWLGSALVSPGFLGRPRLDGSARSDAALGWEAAGALGKAGIGQTAVACGGRIVAVEAAEGTDDTIERAGQLAGPGAVVVKRARPGQDLRFDLPAVGSGTIEVMVKARAQALVVEAHRTLLLDRLEALSLADAHGIAVVGVPSAGPASLDLG